MATLIARGAIGSTRRWVAALAMTLLVVGVMPAASASGLGLSVDNSSLNFGDQLVGTTSSALTVTVSDNYTGQAITSVIIDGADSDQFGIDSTDCGGFLSGGSSCTVNVTFTPTSAGTKSAALQVVGDNQQESVSLAGNGTLPPFVSVWKTDNVTVGSSPSKAIVLPLLPDGSYSFTVDWGDGSVGTVSSWNDVDAAHTYANAGTYTVTMSGEIVGWSFGLAATSDAGKLIDITQWGALRFGTGSPNYSTTFLNGGLYFQEACNLNPTATDAPDLTGTTSLLNAFACTSGSSAFDAPIGNWDVSGVSNFQSVFYGATSFNQDISTWNTSAATTMDHMFYNAASFNQGIGAWDVSGVADFDSMFHGASSFNQDISAWDTSSATAMEHMFHDASSFNQDISSWNVSAATNLRSMLQGASSFNWDLGGWNVSNVTTMNDMLSGSGLSLANYDRLLNGWSTISSGETALQAGVTLEAGSRTYSYRGAAARAALVSTYGWTINDGGRARLTAPTAVTLSAPRAGTLLISWTASAASGSGSVDRYIARIYRDSSLVGFCVTSTVSCTRSGLSSGTYTVQVRPFSMESLAGPLSALSSPLSLAVLPSAPRSASVSALGAGTLAVSAASPLSDGGVGATVGDYSIRLFRGGVLIRSCTAAAVAWAPTSASLCTFTGLPAGSYTATVRASAGAGWGPSITTGTTSLVTGTPVAPATPVASVPSAQSVEVQWDEPTDTGGSAVVDYLVIVRVAGSVYRTMTVAAPTRTAALSLPPATYSVTVRARNSTGWGPVSQAATVNVPL